MSASPETMSKPSERHATLSLAGEVLTARVPNDINEKEFARVASSAFGLINKKTGCTCLSGRIKFVVEDHFGDVIQVKLQG
jgi:hypothetical protein